MKTKPRSDAVLKNLSEERQAEVFQRLTVKTASWLDTSLTAVKKWLAEDAINTSERALSQFCSWYALKQQLQRNGDTVATLLEEFQKDNPEASPETIQRIGQSFFSALALEQQDVKGWFLTQQLNLKQQQLGLDSRRILLLEKKAAAYDRAQAALDKAKTSKGGLTPETLKQIEQELKLL